ncbi:ComEC/Rec2 family competence protein [Oryzihumus sp.]
MTAGPAGAAASSGRVGPAGAAVSPEPSGRGASPDQPPGEGRTARLDMRLLLPAMAAWAAVAAALAAPAGVLWCAGATTGALGAWLTVRPPGRLAGRAATPALTLLATALCLVATAAHISVRDAGLVPRLAAQRATGTVEGTVTADPRVVTRTGVMHTTLVVVRLQVDDVVGRGEHSGAASPVLVFGDESWARVRWHERVRISGRFDVAEPGDDVVAVFNPSGAPRSLAGPGVVADAAERVRSGLRQAVSGLPADARGLLPGLVIGDTSRTPADLTEAMQATGMTHLSAVSGSNVAVVLAAAMGLCRVAGIRRRWRPWVAALCLAAFVVLARPEPSVLRAAVMGGVGLLGLSTSRRKAGLPALAAAVVVLLCLDPWLSRSFGFALSTLATLGLLLFAAPWGRRIVAVLPPRLQGFGTALAIPVAAQLMCGPVVVLLQGSVSVVGVAANLAAAPLVGPATVLGVACALVALVSHPLAVGLAWLAGLPTLGIAEVGRMAAQVPMGQLPWPDGAPGAVLLAVVSLLVLLMAPWLAATVRRRPVLLLGVALLVAAAAAPTTSWSWPPLAWQVVACDVGQGDGLVLSTGPGHAVVVDTGPDPAPMDACLSRLHVTVVDAVVLTHFHADHVDGLPGVLHGRTVRQVLTSPVRDPPEGAAQVDRQAAAAGVPVQPLYAGDDLRFGSLRAHVVWPDRVIREGSVPNNASVVMVVQDAGLRVLMLGDVETPAAHQVFLALRHEGEARRFDVLKVAHHGSSLQDPQLVAATGAPIGLISVGAGNDYGHPTNKTLKLLRDNGIRALRTDLLGDVAVGRTSEGRVLVSTRGP